MERPRCPHLPVLGGVVGGLLFRVGAMLKRGRAVRAGFSLLFRRLPRLESASRPVPLRQPSVRTRSLVRRMERSPLAFTVARLEKAPHPFAVIKLDSQRTDATGMDRLTVGWRPLERS